MVNVTPNYKLKKPTPEEFYDIDVSNRNMDAIDEQLKKVEDKVDTKVDKIEGKGLSTNDFTNEDKNKFAGIEANANKYVHPNDANTRHVTDAEKAEWGGKASKAIATPTANGLMSASDKGKLDNTYTKAEVYAKGEVQEQIDDVRSFIGYEEDDVYGVEVDFVNKKFTRLAGAEGKTAGVDFNNLKPWGGRKRCIVTDAGMVLAYHGETGYTETGALTTAITKNGAAYPIGTKVQVMVEQPIFYTKVVPISTKNASSGRGKQLVKARYYISPTPRVGFKVNEVFKDDNGILQDHIYLSAYEPV